MSEKCLKKDVKNCKLFCMNKTKRTENPARPRPLFAWECVTSDRPISEAPAEIPGLQSPVSRSRSPFPVTSSRFVFPHFLGGCFCGRGFFLSTKQPVGVEMKYVDESLINLRHDKTSGVVCGCVCDSVVCLLPLWHFLLAF